MKLMSPSNDYLQLVGGMLGGATEAVLLQPLDLMKTRLQMDSAKNFRGIAHCERTIFAKEGFLAFYKGLTPFMGNLICKYGLRFYSHSKFKTLLGADRFDPTSRAFLTRTFLAGLMTGTLESLAIVTPLDVVKIRLQNQIGFNKQKIQYRNPVHAAVTIVRREGLCALWKGALPTVIRNSSNQAVMFSSVLLLNQKVWGKQPGDGKVLPWWQTALSGFVGGSFAPCPNNPIDVVKTRLMASTSPGAKAAALSTGVPAVHYTGMWDCLTKVYRTEGAAALFKGLPLRVVRIGPGMAISWTVISKFVNYYENTV